MKVTKKDRKDVGCCNFCSYTNAYIKVYEITGEGHGPQVSVRFCANCFKKAKTKINKL